MINGIIPRIENHIYYSVGYHEQQILNPERWHVWSAVSFKNPKSACTLELLKLPARHTHDYIINSCSSKNIITRVNDECIFTELSTKQ